MSKIVPRNSLMDESRVLAGEIAAGPGIEAFAEKRVPEFPPLTARRIT